MQNKDFITPETLLSFSVACGAVYAITLSIQSAFKLKNPLKIAFFTSHIISVLIMLKLYALTWTTLYMAPLNGFLMYASVLGAVQSLHHEKAPTSPNGTGEQAQPRKKSYKSAGDKSTKKVGYKEKFDIFAKWY